MFRLSVSAALVALGLSLPASAATIDPEAMLKSFSVIALGNYTLNSDMPAPAYAGGDFRNSGHSINNNGNFADGTVGNATGSLIVGGRVLPSGSSNVKGNVVIGANQTVTQPAPPQLRFDVEGSQFNLNRAGTTVRSGVAIPVADVTTAFRTLSTNLSTSAPTATYAIAGDSNNPRLKFSLASDGIAVVNLSATDLSRILGQNRNAQFDLGGNSTAIFNVAGSSFATQGGNLNLNGGLANVIFNFYEATSITLNNTFGASILAPLADVFARTGGSNVFLVGNNVTQNYEIRSPFSGRLPTFVPETPVPAPVPLPAAAFLLIAGLGGFGALRAFRRA